MYCINEFQEVQARIDCAKRAQSFGTRLPWQPDFAIDSHKTYYVIVPPPGVYYTGTGICVSSCIM